MNRKWVYDVEVFPNFFSVVFEDIESEECKTFYVRDLDERGFIFRQLRDFITDSLLIGYNNHSYDDIIINFILKSQKIDVKEIYKLSNRIINKQNSNEPIWKDSIIKWLIKPYDRTYKSIDLMRILAFDKLFIGLKQCSVNLRHDRIQDLPKKFLEAVEVWEIDEILDYNKNDAKITKKLYFEIYDEIELRENIGREYKVDLSSASRTYIAKAILNNYYAKYTGLNYKDFKDLRSFRANILFSDCISKKINFKTPHFIQMLDDLKKVRVTQTKGAIDYSIIDNGKKYQLGTGGLHSVDTPAIYEETEEYYLIDADVASFYPKMMINEKIKPAHLTDAFTEILKDLTDRRLEAKANKDKITAETLKISINSMFGLSNFMNYWLYDPQAFVSVTISGQLFLLMLVETLTSNGFEVISANTDGVTAKVPKHREEEYYYLCSKWEEANDFELEYAYYEKYIRRDVNNYITKTYKTKEKGVYYDKISVKKKGAFVDKGSLSKAFSMPIVAIALEEYYLNKKPILETLKNHKDIYDFCKSQKTGSQFIVLHKTIEELPDGNRRIKAEKLQKTNRYFVSKQGGSLVKLKNNGSETNMEVGYITTILNDFDYDADYISNVDYSYYERECNKIIEIINKEVLQTSLF